MSRAASMAPPIKGVIFDLDGTLIDSEPNYYESDRLLLAEYGIAFSQADKRRYVGTGNNFMMEDLYRRYALPDGPEVLLEEKNRLYMDLARRHTALLPEMGRLLPGLHALGLPLAVASGSSPDVLRELLEQTGILGYFSVLVSSEEVAKGKPAPDIFLETARRMACTPENLVVLEDSVSGVLSGLAAGMRVVAIPGFPETPLEPEFERAHLLFRGGHGEFRAERFLSWLKEQGLST